MGISILGHGGGCCGINHARGFSFQSDVEFDREMKKLQQCVKISRDRSTLVEVVVNETQLRGRGEDLPKALKKMGFRCVTSFINGNSGNLVHVFHYHKKRKRFTWGV